jgi:hypothetical protein
VALSRLLPARCHIHPVADGEGGLAGGRWVGRRKVGWPAEGRLAGGEGGLAGGVGLASEEGRLAGGER